MLLIDWKRQIKITMRYQFIPIQLAKIKNYDNDKYQRECELIGFLIQTLGSENGHDHFGKFVII